MAGKRYKKILVAGLIIFLALFILLNVFAAIHAYNLSHFKDGVTALTPDYKPSFTETIKIATCGLDLPRPYTKKYPTVDYDSLSISAGEGKLLDAWLLHTDSLKQGLIIAFHGYMDEKSSMLDRAEALLDMGYDVLLVNFMGAGHSYGNQTTMGYLEAENVVAAHKYAIAELGEDNIILLGFSMGAAAIMRAQSEHDLLVKALILEAPYGTFTETVNARLKHYNVPSFPVCDIFTFWFGKLNGFDGFNANPQNYGENIHVPVLLMGGGQDQNIPVNETETIYNMLASKHKEMKIFDESPHESYLKKYPEEWAETVKRYLANLYELDVYHEQ
ncbi:MAG: alpha/beta hydrolase family protein [Dysgonomonas sp.]